MKKFVMLGAFSKGRKPRGDPGGKSVVPIPGERRSQQSLNDPASIPGKLHD
jgi:hypothetical protein